MPEHVTLDQPKRSNFFRFLGYVWPYKFYVAAGAIGGIVKFGVPFDLYDMAGHRHS